MKKDTGVLRYMRERAPWYQSGTGCSCWLLGSSGAPFNGAQYNRISAGMGERSLRSRGLLLFYP